jgi:CHASE1-domain containing sensor protein
MSDQINVHSRKTSFMLSALIAVVVALFVALIFGAVLVVINSNNKHTNAQRAFSREVSCQLIAATQESNGDLLYKTALAAHASKAKAEGIRQSYERQLSQNTEKRLGIAGRILINSDGSLNCNAYVALGNRTGPIKK